MLTLQQMNDAEKRHANYYLNQLREVSQLFEQGGTAMTIALQKVKRLWGQIQQGQAWAAGHLDVFEAASMCLAFSETTTDLLMAFQPLEERIRWLSDSLAAARRIGNHAAEARFLIELGEVRLFRGQEPIDKSIALVQEALALAREHQLPAPEARALLSLGRIESLHPSNWNRAREMMTEALSKFRGINDSVGTSDSLRNLGMLEEKAGNLEQAKAYQHEALAIYQTLRDERSAAIVLSRLASIAEREADYVTGRSYAEQALVIARQTGNIRAIVLALSTLALICDYLGERSRSSEHFLEMLHLSRSIGDGRYTNLALTNLGYLAIMNGEFDQALTYYTEVLIIARRAKDRYRETVALVSLSSVYLDTEKVEDASSCLRDALRTAREIQAEDLLFNALLEHARLLVLRGQIDDGAEIYGLALSLPASKDPQEQEYIDRTLAWLQKHMPEERLNAAAERGAVLDIEATVQRLIAET